MRTRNGNGKTGNLAGSRQCPQSQPVNNRRNAPQRQQFDNNRGNQTPQRQRQSQQLNNINQARPQRQRQSQQLNNATQTQPQRQRQSQRLTPQEEMKIRKRRHDRQELNKAKQRKEEPEMSATEFAREIKSMHKSDIPRIDRPAPNVSERVINPTRAQTNNLYKERPKVNNEKPKKKGTQLIFTILAIIVFAIVSVGGYFAWQKFKPISMDDLRLDIVDLYTDKNKVELKETTTLDVVNQLRTDLENIDDKGNVQEKEGLINEVNTISTFINDNALLDQMSDKGYDLTSAEFNENIEKIRASTNTYTIPGLNMTAIGKISTLCAEQRDILNIMNELVTVSNSVDKSPVSYIDTIQEKVTHTPNQEALVNCVSLIEEKQTNLIQLEDLKKDMKKNKKQIEETQNKLTDLQNQINEILDPETDSVE